MSRTVLCNSSDSSSIKFGLFDVACHDELQLTLQGQLDGIGPHPLLLAHPRLSSAELKAALRDQWLIAHLDERVAIETLPHLPPQNCADRRALLDAIKAIVAEVGELSIDGQRRWAKIAQLFDSGSQRPPEAAGCRVVDCEGCNRVSPVTLFQLQGARRDSGP